MLLVLLALQVRLWFSTRIRNRDGIITYHLLIRQAKPGRMVGYCALTGTDMEQSRPWGRSKHWFLRLAFNQEDAGSIPVGPTMTYKNKDEYNRYMREYMLRRYVRRREEAIVLLGGRCVVCGAEENLEFDHINPEEKDFTIGSGSSFSDERWNKEISKCQLLCNTCHMDKHRSLHPCGTAQRYWAGCRCSECRAANAAHGREYKRCRSEKN